MGGVLKELEEKLHHAKGELEETQEAYQQTKVEYERLEQELEELNTYLDQIKERQQQNALTKQQYEGQIKILEEQVLAGKQNSDHYRNRLGILKEELKKREEEKQKISEEKEELQGRLKEQRQKIREENQRLESIQAEAAECSASVEEGKKRDHRDPEQPCHYKR